MAANKKWIYMQSGVIPYTLDEGGIKLLLITSRNGRRWIFPKGIIEDNLTPQRSAEKEAFEEAGVIGSVSDAAIGEYQVAKWGGICQIKLFALKVENVLESWPEDFRERRWVSMIESHELVEQKELKTIILKLPEFLRT
jgi:8-oxo-dGTP pyrophosphatase MutT (NUDIX family)